MEPIPLWVRLTGAALAVLVVPVTAGVVLTGTVSLVAVTAGSHRTQSFDVGAAPRVLVDASFASVVVEAGPDGQVGVDQEREASSITRAAAAAALGRPEVRLSQQGELVEVVEGTSGFGPEAINRGSTIRLRVPRHTDLRLTGSGLVEVQGVAGTFQVDGANDVQLRDVTLEGASTVSSPVGEIVMRNVTVTGDLTVRALAGAVVFDGALADGGHSLDVRARAGGVRITLPRPTDARATVTTSVGALHADPAWRFAPDRVENPQRWTADLGEDPKGIVTVSTTFGDVRFDVR